MSTETTHVYRKVDGHELSLIVHTPAAPAPAAGRAAIVFFFGGGFVGGTVEQFAPHCRYLAERGMTAIRADYRVKSRHESTPPQSVADGRAAVRWIRQNAEMLGVNPHRLAAGGGSAGGGVAAGTGIIRPDAEPTDSRPDALVLFNPVVVAAAIDGVETRPDARVEMYRNRWGSEGLEEISAYHHIDAGAPPTLVLHGEADEICPLSTIHPFVEKMRNCSVRCELVLYPEQGHGFFNYEREADHAHFRRTLAEADRFLASMGYLDGEPVVDAWLAAENPPA